MGINSAARARSKHAKKKTKIGRKLARHTRRVRQKK